MQQRRVYVMGVHVLGWLLFLSLVLVFTLNMPAGQAAGRFVPSFLLFIATYLLLFYLNAYVLLPRLYLRRHYLAYILVITGLFAGVCLLQPFERLQHRQQPLARTVLFGHGTGPRREPPPEGLPGPQPHDPPAPPAFGDQPRQPGANGQPLFDIVSIILFFMTWAFSTVLEFFRKWRTTEQRARQAEVDKATAELSFLKAQINPHFLFNTLNNLYSMALSGNVHTAEAILKLSNIMRYVTDEVNQEFVPLQSEIDCVADFILLQRLRMGSKTPVQFTVTGDAGGRQIAPMVFMTFVENVFKYGVSSHDPAPITIRIDVEEGQTKFFCSNRIFPIQKPLERGGIGIANTRARLERLYPGRHRLEITRNGQFIVALVIGSV